MAEIIVYSSSTCPYCTMAKRLLDRKGMTYTEINIDQIPGAREEMVLKSKRRTVPQIFIGGLHIGGFNELYALDQKNGLTQEETTPNLG